MKPPSLTNLHLPLVNGRNLAPLPTLEAARNASVALGPPLLMSRSFIMQRHLSILALCAATTVELSGCGGGSVTGDNSGGPGPAAALVSYLGTTGVFVASVDPTSGNYAAAPIGSYAGKKQSLRGTVDFLTGADLGQPAGIEIYKGDDGHIYALDLTSTNAPAPQQLSSESAATIDDTCTLSGTAVPGANYDYVGVYFTADLQTTTNSSYVYRLPGPDGVCNTADDVIQMVKTGMAPDTAPMTVSAMPLATVRTAQVSELGVSGTEWSRSAAPPRGIVGMPGRVQSSHRAHWE
jgi:hypothetical protein